jgi:hypothetical protein
MGTRPSPRQAAAAAAGGEGAWRRQLSNLLQWVSQCPRESFSYVYYFLFLQEQLKGIIIHQPQVARESKNNPHNHVQYLQVEVGFSGRAQQLAM